jgi:pimeloyl-ACP methyl ester carboxylesterase
MKAQELISSDCGGLWRTIFGSFVLVHFPMRSSTSARSTISPLVPTRITRQRRRYLCFPADDRAFVRGHHPEYDAHPEMEALDIPVKLIWRENDPYLNVGVAEDLRSHLSDASLHRIPAGHWAQIDEPELVASAMLS